MARRVDPARLRLARLDAATTTVSDEIRRQPGLEASHRGEWPELWRRLARLVALVDSAGWADRLGPR